MREYAVPSSAPASTGRLSDDLVRWESESPGRPLLVRRGPDGWYDVDAAEVAATVRAVARGLVAAGLGPGDRVAIWSSTRPEWTLLDYAVWWIGAVSVPVYDSAPATVVRSMLADAGAVALVAEHDGHLAALAEVRADLPGLRHVWTLDDGALEELTATGGSVDDSELDRLRTSVGSGDPATIIYTSGTTGRAKGCLLTHGNLLAQLDAVLPELAVLFDGEDATTLLFLPLPHVFARVIQIGCVRSGVRLAHSAGMAGLAQDLRDVRPTFLLGVPRAFEAVFNRSSQRAAADGRGRLFARATSVAIAWSRARERRRGSAWLSGQRAVLDRLVLSRLRDELGGRCAHVICGGAPMGEQLAHYFAGAGVDVLEGYGLTETSGAVTMNRPGQARIGSVGQPLPGTAVRVSDEGELLFRGPQVFTEYWNDPAATAEVLVDGWLHTGDLGEIDGEGFVRVTGRRHEVIVTAGGKQVVPSVLEDRVRAHPLVSHCLVVGDGQPFVGALVTLDESATRAWAKEHGRATTQQRAWATDPDLLAEIQEAVDAANTAVSHAESIRRFTVLSEDWTEEAGLVTPSMKLKRAVVLQRCKDDIASLYA